MTDVVHPAAPDRHRLAGPAAPGPPAEEALPGVAGRSLRALRSLLRATLLSGPDDLPAMVSNAARELGARAGLLYLADYDQVLLVPLVPPGAPRADAAGPAPVAIEGTLAGRSFADVVQHTTTSGGGCLIWSPVLDGTERLGVLRLDFGPDSELGDELKQSCQDVAALVGELVMTRSLYGDAVERARRRVGMTVPAELQWRLLPPLTFVAPRVAVAGVLAPTAQVAGDTFDYALNGDTLHLLLLDAMGHGLEATLLAAVAVSTVRNARRGGADLSTTVRAVDSAVAAQFGPDRFLTGIVGELDIATGWWRWVTCGHPPALVVRDGRVVKTLDAVVNAPLGLGLLDDDLSAGQERLEPGDRLLLYTDGVVEARDGNGEFFGPERLVEFVTRQAAAGRPAPETLRRLNHAILDHQDGSLQDDATTVLVEWLTDEPDRTSP